MNGVNKTLYIPLYGKAFVSKKRIILEDKDFPEVIEERGRYFSESENYRMIAGNATECGWVDKIDADSLTVVMEGVSMYIPEQELKNLFSVLEQRFSTVALLVDCYSSFAARMSKYKNPINEVGVSEVYGIDEPEHLSVGSLSFVCEHEMTPLRYIDELSGLEKRFSRSYTQVNSRVSSISFLSIKNKKKHGILR